MSTIIEVAGISKSYKLSHQTKSSHRSLREELVNSLTKVKRLSKSNEETFWALKNVSFKVDKGEVIGIIGRNGAGKSTLLKILSRVVDPTDGQIIMRGRVASLLEVGTGFHPELTGRENIFLNGAILGMTRAEIGRKFDQIVDFAGVEKFLDTPVKHYSSGMFVRLAFSVAAHLEPDILIVDEVLAVGDDKFQKKSLGKMDEVSKKSDRTIIFVSHNMDAIRQLCKKCILLQDGQVAMFDDTDKVVRHYLQEENKLTRVSLRNRKDRQGLGGVKFTDIEVTNTNNSKKISSGDGLRFIMKYESDFKKPIENVRVVVIVVNDDLRNVLWLDSDTTANTIPNNLAPKGEIICETESANLTRGRYFVHINFHINGESRDFVTMAATIDVETDPSRYDFVKDPDNTVNDYLIKFQFSDGKLSKK